MHVLQKTLQNGLQKLQKLRMPAAAALLLCTSQTAVPGKDLYEVWILGNCRAASGASEMSEL
jgi:hypothetical protein